MSTTRPGRRARWSAGHARAQRTSGRSFEIGPAAERWLLRAAADRGASACGARRSRRSTSPSCTAPSRSTGRSDACAQAGRFADGDLAAVLAHQQRTGELVLFPRPRARTARCRLDAQAGRGSGDDRHDTSPHHRSPTSSSALRRLRLPYVRKARTRGDRDRHLPALGPAEVLRVLLAEEAAGRDRATTQMRRRSSGLPAGKTFDAWDPAASAIPTQTQQALRTLEWIGRAENAGDLRAVRDRQEPLHRSVGPPRDRPRQNRRVAHPRDARRARSTATAPMTASTRRSAS